MHNVRHFIASNQTDPSCKSVEITVDLDPGGWETRSRTRISSQLLRSRCHLEGIHVDARGHEPALLPKCARAPPHHGCLPALLLFAGQQLMFGRHPFYSVTCSDTVEHVIGKWQLWEWQLLQTLLRIFGLTVGSKRSLSVPLLGTGSRGCAMT